MRFDYPTVIEAEGARVVAALGVARDARIPWSDSWTVATCVRHVGGAHHVVGQVVEDRPTGDFSAFARLEMPEGDDPGLAAWVEEGTQKVVAQLRATDREAECWSWWPEGRSAAFWQRRMAHETLVHRWDAELGAGIVGDSMDPAVAADGIDEYLDVFVGISRVVHSAPQGPSIHVHCTDTEGEWLLTLPEPGQRVLTREHAKGDMAMRGSAEALLLTMWGRLDAAAAGVEVVGDAGVMERWAELIPPM